MSKRRPLDRGWATQKSRRPPKITKSRGSSSGESNEGPAELTRFKKFRIRFSLIANIFLFLKPISAHEFFNASCFSIWAANPPIKTNSRTRPDVANNFAR